MSREAANGGGRYLGKELHRGKSHYGQGILPRYQGIQDLRAIPGLEYRLSSCSVYLTNVTILALTY